MIVFSLLCGQWCFLPSIVLWKKIKNSHASLCACISFFIICANINLNGLILESVISTSVWHDYHLCPIFKAQLFNSTAGFLHCRYFSKCKLWGKQWSLSCGVLYLLVWTDSYSFSQGEKENNYWSTIWNWSYNRFCSYCNILLHVQIVIPIAEQAGRT